MTTGATDKSIEQEGQDYSNSLDGQDLAEWPFVIARRAYIAGRSQGLERDSEALYWKQLLEQILLQMEWGNKKISLEERIISLFNNRPEVIIGINTETKSLGIMLNSDMDTNGASQEKPNQGENDDKTKKP